jgi:hypothetical protein
MFTGKLGLPNAAQRLYTASGVHVTSINMQKIPELHTSDPEKPVLLWVTLGEPFRNPKVD